MDRLHAMEAFVRIVESGSFSAAARDMGIGQPAASKIVAALEDQLGVRLLVRSTRTLLPTDAGQAYYERARRVIAEADEAEIAARGVGTSLQGRLRICAPVTFARLHVAPKLGAFMAAHRQLHLEVIMEDSAIDLLEHNIDVALSLGDLADSAMTARKLAQTKRMIVASSDYLTSQGIPKSPGDLLSHQIIIYNQAVGGDEWRFRRGTSELSVQVQGRLMFSAAEGVREAVLAGLGLGIVSRWMMLPELRDGTVIPVLTDWTLPAVDLWAITPSGRLPSSRARAFIDWFANMFKTTDLSL